MNDYLFNANYDVTKKSKVKKIYEKYKIYIFSLTIISIIIFVSSSIYYNSKKNKRILLSENYLQAKLFLDTKKKDKAKNILKNIILENDPVYSTLSLHLIINENLINNSEELLALFDHILDKNSFSKDLKSLLIYKKALVHSDSVSETELLDLVDPLINSDTHWKPLALLLVGDFFISNKQNKKAADFYKQVFSINNLHQDLYNHARSQLSIIDD